MTRPTRERIEEIRRKAEAREGFGATPAADTRTDLFRDRTDLLAELDARDGAAVLEEAAEAMVHERESDHRSLIARLAECSRVDDEIAAVQSWLRSRAAQLRKEGGKVPAKCDDCTHLSDMADTDCCGHPVIRQLGPRHRLYVDSAVIGALQPPSWCPLRSSGKEGPR